MAERVYIGIGSNMGDKEGNILGALRMLGEDGRLSAQGSAPLYKTGPVGYTDQDWFLNTVAAYETALTPHELLGALMGIEKKMGRERTVRWGPRVIDLDILLYGDAVVNTPDLQIPHPRIVERAFVVVPLADLAPDILLPGGKTAASLVVDLSKTQAVERYKA
ncbi:MAG: 2-amino-4-hydroxy-6-hydroxymethyldihydropteridine diphosphokinase [Actinobacteria bacterium]|nr:2-amino-4-hydroxy-6-hydroxymethyldihydropteridine diphosphokinase [Actinomycetota bacterium]